MPKVLTSREIRRVSVIADYGSYGGLYSNLWLNVLTLTREMLVYSLKSFTRHLLQVVYDMPNRLTDSGVIFLQV